MVGQGIGRVGDGRAFGALGSGSAIRTLGHTARAGFRVFAVGQFARRGTAGPIESIRGPVPHGERRVSGQHCRARPTVAVLIKIARGPGRSPVDLFEGCTTAAQVIHRRAAEEDAGANGNHGPHQLTGQLSAPQLSLWRVVHAPGEGTEARHLAPRGEVVIFCEEGLLEVTSGKQVFSLEPGDSLHSKTREGLSWRAAGDASSRFVPIGTSVLGLDRILAGSGFSRVASSSVPA